MALLPPALSSEILGKPGRQRWHQKMPAYPQGTSPISLAFPSRPGGRPPSKPPFRPHSAGTRLSGLAWPSWARGHFLFQSNPPCFDYKVDPSGFPLPPIQGRGHSLLVDRTMNAKYNFINAPGRPSSQPRRYLRQGHLRGDLWAAFQIEVSSKQRERDSLELPFPGVIQGIPVTELKGFGVGPHGVDGLG